LVTAATNTVGGKSLLLTDQEKKDIILFLNMLTDQDFVKNPKYASPF